MNNVIELTLTGHRPKRPRGDIDAVIRQEDLEDLLILKRRAHEALAALKKKNDLLLWMALNGIPVETGARTARTILVRRARHHVNGHQFYKLVVR